MDLPRLIAQGAAPGTGGGDESWLIWAIVLLAVAAALFFVEVFLPTGGLLGIASGIAAVAGVVMFFQVDTLLGMASAAVCLISLPFLLMFAIKIWPDTPFGRWVTLKDEQELSDSPGDTRAETQHAGWPNPIATGEEGKTLTPLRPVGTCLIGGRREECLARRGTIDAGVAVRVVAVDGGQVFVSEVGQESR